METWAVHLRGLWTSSIERSVRAPRRRCTLGKSHPQQPVSAAAGSNPSRWGDANRFVESRLVDKSGAQAYRTRWRRCCQHVIRCLWISDGARSLRASLATARRCYRDPAACGQARVQANGDVSRDRSACRIRCDRLRHVATSQRRPRCHYGDAVARIPVDNRARYRHAAWSESQGHRGHARFGQVSAANCDAPLTSQPEARRPQASGFAATCGQVLS